MFLFSRTPKEVVRENKQPVPFPLFPTFLFRWIPNEARRRLSKETKSDTHLFHILDENGLPVNHKSSSFSKEKWSPNHKHLLTAHGSVFRTRIFRTRKGSKYKAGFVFLTNYSKHETAKCVWQHLSIWIKTWRLSPESSGLGCWHTHTQKVISNSPRQPHQTSNIPHSVLDPLVGIGVEELLMFANLSTDSTTTIQRLLQQHT